MKKLSFRIDAADACRKPITLPARRRRGRGAGKGCPGTEGAVAHGLGLLGLTLTHSEEKVA